MFLFLDSLSDLKLYIELFSIVFVSSINTILGFLPKQRRTVSLKFVKDLLVCQRAGFCWGGHE